MNDFKVGDIVARKSYNNDVYFTIVGITADDKGNKRYILRGYVHRIMADSDGEDLVKYDARMVYNHLKKHVAVSSRYASRNMPVRGLFLDKLRIRTGRILHIDSSKNYLDICLKHYRNMGLTAIGKLAPESEQTYIVRKVLQQYNPDILIVTGHDGIYKNSDKYSIDSYRNSKYYIKSVQEARKYQSDMNKLCVFAGACQSYFEEIMKAGANFASSPGRVLINAIDPALVGEKIAVTD